MPDMTYNQLASQYGGLLRPSPETLLGNIAPAAYGMAREPRYQGWDQSGPIPTPNDMPIPGSQYGDMENPVQAPQEGGGNLLWEILNGAMARRAMGMPDEFSSDMMGGGILGGIGATFANAATNPLTYAPAVGLGLGKLASRFMQPSAASRLSLLANEARAASPVSLPAPKNPFAGMTPPSVPPTSPPTMGPPLPPLPMRGYSPQDLAFTNPGNVAPTFTRSLEGAGRPYQQVNPMIEALMQQQMGATAARGNLPNWAQVRGGRVLPTPGMEGTMEHLMDLSAPMDAPVRAGEMQRMLERLRQMSAGM